jgi:adenosine deaminase
MRRRKNLFVRLVALGLVPAMLQQTLLAASNISSSPAVTGGGPIILLTAMMDPGLRLAGMTTRDFGSQALAGAALWEEIPWLTKTAAQLRRQLGPAHSSSTIQSLIGHGRYGHRQFSNGPFIDLAPGKYDDPRSYLQTPQEEVVHLLDHLIARSSGDERIRLEQERAALNVEKIAPDQLSKKIGELRQILYYKDVSDPAIQKRWPWLEALPVIDRNLSTLREKHGDFVYERTLRMIAELETALPFFDERKPSRQEACQYDNFRLFVTDIYHGLAHSLDVLDDFLDDAKYTFNKPEQKEQLQRAKEILIGAALYHDLPGLRERDNHHKAAYNFVMAVLSVQTDVEGKRYDPNLVYRIARASKNHRGQSYDPPEDEIDEIVRDGDEGNILKHVDRAFNQWSNGTFNPDFFDAYREICLRELRSQAGDSRHRHETDFMDRFGYALMHLIVRADPASYARPILKMRLAQAYGAYKRLVVRIMKSRIQQEIYADESIPAVLKMFEFKKRIYRIKGIIRELEVLFHKNARAQQRIIQDMGNASTLRENTRILYQKIIKEELPRHSEKGPYKNAIDLLRLARDARKGKRGRGGRERVDYPKVQLESGVTLREVFPNKDFKRGQRLADQLLENPQLALAEALEKERETVESVDYLYAGFADAVAQIFVGYRVKQLLRIVHPITNGNSTSELVLKSEIQKEVQNLDIDLGYAMAELLLRELNDGRDPSQIITEIRHRLDSLRYGPVRPETWDANPLYTTVEDLLHAITSRAKVNLHVHVSGALTVEQMATFYRQDSRLVVIFQQKYPRVDPTNPEELRQFLYEHEIDSTESFELAFEPGHIILNNDDPDFLYHRLWFKTIIEDAAAEGTRLVGVVSTFDQEYRSPEEFARVVEAALHGIMEGEKTSPGAQGALILGIRKNLDGAKAEKLVEQWLALKEHFAKTKPAYAQRMLGIDSVGHEGGFFFKNHRKAFERARAAGQWIKVHVGEFWEPGHLMEALEQIETVVDSGLADQITNAIALFVNPASLNSGLYTEEMRQSIMQTQERIIKKVVNRHIFIEISPSSNHRIARQNRRREGALFHRVDMLMYRGLLVVPTSDDPGLFETDLPLEFLQLYLGWTAYGAVSFEFLERLLQIGEDLLKRVADRQERHMSSPRAIPGARQGRIAA